MLRVPCTVGTVGAALILGAVLALPLPAAASGSGARLPRLLIANTAATVAEGQLLSGTVATITGRIAAKGVTATIVWGDGHRSRATIAAGSGRLSIAATHVFKDEGRFSAMIAAHDNHGHAMIGRETVTVTEADAFAAPVSDPRPAAVNKPVTGQIALFTNTGYPANVPGDFKATIDWGDGTTTPGAVTRPSSGTFAVSGTHTYTTAKLFWAVITIKDDRPGTQISTTRVPINVTAATS